MVVMSQDVPSTGTAMQRCLGASLQMSSLLVPRQMSGRDRVGDLGKVEMLNDRYEFLIFIGRYLEML